MPRSISVAMIVRDEAANLAECLLGLGKLADEICVVDTGSQDDTVAIARQFNAKVSYFLWCDDFSAARNESLRACTKDWIFILDADERIAPHDVSAIRALADEPSNTAWRFVTRNYTNVQAVSDFQRVAPADGFGRGFAGWYPSVKVRFFPNRMGAKFSGKVHEAVHESLEQRGIRLRMCEAPIHHYAALKSPDQLLRKQALYLQLGHEKIKADPGNPYFYIELGNQYAEVRDWVGAVGAYKEALRRDPANAAVLKDLGGVLHLAGKDDEAKAALKIALQLDPGFNDAWRNLGIVYMDEKEWMMAAECFEQGIERDRAWAEGYRGLSLALAGAGKVAAAAAASRKSLELDPNNGECLQQYMHQMLRLEKRADARQFLQSLIENGAANPVTQNALGELSYYDDLLDEAVTHFQAACEADYAPACNNLGVVLYRLKRYPEAREAFEHCLRLDPGHHGAQANLEKARRHA